MATVTGLTKERMLEIEAASVVNGVVNGSGDLILETHDGTQFSAGHVKGADGANATALLTVEDTATVDLEKTGAGTVASPWLLKANLILPAVEKAGLRLTTYDAATDQWSVKGTDGNTYGPYPYAREYIPTPGDTVFLNKDGLGSYVITSSLRDWKPLLGGTGSFTSYNANNADNQWNYLEYCVRNGFVSLRGLLAFGSTAMGQVIGVLPVGARPDKDMVVKINNSDVIREVNIAANGVISASTVTINGFYSLDGIMFPAAGKATWTYVGDSGSGLAFANGWKHYGGGTTSYGKVGLWRDEYDFIWMCGLMDGGSLVGNSVMIDITNPNFLPWNGIPVASAVGGEQHMATVCWSLIGGLNIVGGTVNAIRIGAGVSHASNGWFSLAGKYYLSSAAYVHPDWVEHPNERIMSNGWLTYAAGYPTFAYRQRPDGMVVTKGLIRSGTMGRIDWMPDSYRTKKNHLFSNVANGAYNRIDMWGEQSTNSIGGTGVLSPSSGSNAWFSMDNICWFPD